MAVHPAVQSLCELPLDTIGLTAVANVVSALSDVAVATELIQQPAQAKALQEVLRRCMAILNNAGKNYALRLACLECLYTLSQPAIPAFRTGPLCQALNTMNSSVDEMLANNEARTSAASGEGVLAAREMMAVLIFRFTDYDTKVSRLLLQHTCDGDVAAMAQLLLRVVVQHRQTCEWPLLQAVLQTFYELTLPATYFDAAATPGKEQQGAVSSGSSSGANATATGASSLQTFSVESFQEKVAVLLATVRTHRVLEELLASLRLSWHESTYNRSPPALANGYAESVALGALGRPDVAYTVATATQEQRTELLHWLAAFTLLCRALDNLVDFCRDAQLVRELRGRLLGDASCHDWLGTAAVPAIIAAVQVWGTDFAAATAMAATAPSSPFSSATVKHSLLSTAISLLRLLRLAVYKPTVGFTPVLLTSMACLAAQVQRMEPQLRGQYAGMQVMVLAAECLINMNATTITSPVNLANAYEGMLRAIAADKTRCALSNSYSSGSGGDAAGAGGGGGNSGSGGAGAPTSSMALSAAEWFILCVREEESSYCEAGNTNAALALLHDCFAAEEAKLQNTADRVAELVALETQLAMLQNFLLLMTLTELLGALPDRRLERLTPPSSVASPSASSAAASRAKASKSGKKRAANHPAAFVCDLTGKLMREPVVLKSGHRFEYDALQNVISQVGHVDPITGEAIDDDVEVDIALQQEIAAYRVKRAAERQGS